MVTKAIERAQNTVEGRNSEIRKDVLKYDEVMNEQRKVIYAFRNQIIDGEDLQERTRESLEATITELVQSACPSEYHEEWELDRLIAELAQYYPTRFSAEDLHEATNSGQVIESVVTEAFEYYDEHSASMPGGEETARQIERDVMLQIIDQRWRDHLAEMDYLREGINLRAMGNQDPLVAWQREGFTMFGQLIESIDDDYLRYILHVEAQVEAAPEPDMARAVYQAADDPVAGTNTLTAAMFADAGGIVDPTEEAVVPTRAQTGTQAPPRPNVASNGANGAAAAPIVKGAQQKVGRNDPCWCGSGKKFKLCHGAA
jgi:preprotein translocase subunit SecA